MEITPTLDTSIYAVGDVLFDTTLLTNIAFANDEPFELDAVNILDKDDQTAYLMGLVFLKANTSIGTIGTTATISDANAENIIGSLSFGTGVTIDMGGCKVALQKALATVLEPAAGTRNVYVAGVVLSGTPTHTANGMILKFRSKRI